jgi:hypothetical protein
MNCLSPWVSGMEKAVNFAASPPHSCPTTKAGEFPPRLVDAPGPAHRDRAAQWP